MSQEKKTARDLSKQQPRGQGAIKILQSVPTKREISNWNDGTQALDETNGILHIKGKKKVWKFQGVPG